MKATLAPRKNVCVSSSDSRRSVSVVLLLVIRMKGSKPLVPALWARMASQRHRPSNMLAHGGTCSSSSIRARACDARSVSAPLH